MMKITWRAGIGYGDFIAGLCYAHNCTVKYNTPVEISFYWPDEPNTKFNRNDPDTLYARFYEILSRLKPANVNIKHEFGIGVPAAKARPRFVNAPDVDNPYHALWYPNKEYDVQEKLVAIWTPRYNMAPIAERKFVPGNWNDLVEHLENSGYEVKEISYRTPIVEALDILERCEFGVGYHGMFHQLFNYLWKPSIILTPQPEFTRTFQLFANLQPDIDSFCKSDVELLVEHSRDLMSITETNFEKYLNS